MSSMHLNQLRKWTMHSPPVEWGVNQLRELLIGSVRQGPVPQHIAFVMDGNRRFARSHKIETVEGHNLGFEALAKVWDIPIREGEAQKEEGNADVDRSWKCATSAESRSSRSMHSALRTLSARNMKSMR